MDEDKELEALIDRAGRRRVFALAQLHGWSPSSYVPKWVWQMLCGEALAGGKPLTPPSPT